MCLIASHRPRRVALASVTLPAPEPPRACLLAYAAGQARTRDDGNHAAYRWSAEPGRGKGQGAERARGVRPKLRLIGRVISVLAWGFPVRAGWCSGYVEVSGIGVPIRSKACRWVLVGSVSIGTSAGAPANRTWLRVRVARWASRPRKLR